MAYSVNKRKIKKFYLDDYNILSNPEYKKILNFGDVDTKKIKTFFENNSINNFLEVTSLVDLHTRVNRLQQKHTIDGDIENSKFK